MSRSGFRGLVVWQKSKDLAALIYRITGTRPFAQDFGLRDQVRRSSVSIPSNIAEGDERDTDKEAVRGFYIAKGSSAELLTQMMIAHEIGHIDISCFEDIENRCREISAMLANLIKARSTKLNRLKITP
jgi:four helix bundle protein